MLSKIFKKGFIDVRLDGGVLFLDRQSQALVEGQPGATEELWTGCRLSWDPVQLCHSLTV